MSNIVQHQRAELPEVSAELRAQVLIAKNTKNLSHDQKLNFLAALCHALGMNPLTNPFEFMTIDGREQFYCKKDATDQLRKLYSVSVLKVETKHEDGFITCVASVSMPSGRTDSATGMVYADGLRGKDLANAFMKAETKAKRRATLSICGLGFLDESEVEDMRQAEPPSPPVSTVIDSEEDRLQRDIESLVSRFRKIGVSESMIVAKCKVPSVADISREQLEELRKIGNQIVIEKKPITDYFGGGEA